MTPAERYRHDLTRPGFSADEAQAEAVRCTQRLYERLLSTAPATRTSRLLDLFNRPVWIKRTEPVKGLYLWGGVGRGKTHIVDGFFNCVPFAEKLRFHFHSFMQMVHNELAGLKDTASPLEMVGERLAKRARLICLDEFHVSDITDAMLLHGLLNALFNRGVTLVATSNEAPDRLYWNGLQRVRFLPAIELLKTNTDVLNVDGGVDYRLRTLEQAEIYHSPLDAQADITLAANFAALTGESGQQNVSIEINDRPIPARRHVAGTVWFDFEALCDGPRGPADYVEIALCYQSVLVSNIPILRATDDDKAKRFITLVDTLYDRNVKLIVSAAAAPDELYQGKRLEKVFERTASRLKEMATKAYLAREHLPE